MNCKTRSRLLGACIAATLSSVALSQTSTAPAGRPPLAEAFGEATEWVRRPAREIMIDAFGAAAEISFREYKEPRPLRIWISKVDLSNPGVRFVLTPPAEFAGDDAKFETRCANTLEFAQQTGVQLAINTSAFAPFRPEAGQPMDVVGLAAIDGKVFSPPDPRFGAMYISKTGRVCLEGPRPAPEQTWQAVGGFRMLLDDEKLAVAKDVARSSFGGLNPRTAVGVDRDGAHLWIVVADGRQPDVSMGITLVELAALFRALGAHDALNLDGGGSTTFVVQNSDRTHEVVNVPVGRKTPGSLRQVANNLGILLPGPPPAPDVRVRAAP